MKINEEILTLLESIKEKAERNMLLSFDEMKILLLASLLEEEGSK